MNLSKGEWKNLKILNIGNMLFNAAENKCNFDCFMTFMANRWRKLEYLHICD